MGKRRNKRMAHYAALPLRSTLNPFFAAPASKGLKLLKRVAEYSESGGSLGPVPQELVAQPVPAVATAHLEQDPDPELGTSQLTRPAHGGSGASPRRLTTPLCTNAPVGSYETSPGADVSIDLFQCLAVAVPIETALGSRGMGRDGTRD